MTNENVRVIFCYKNGTVICLFLLCTQITQKILKRGSHFTFEQDLLTTSCLQEKGKSCIMTNENVRFFATFQLQKYNYFLNLQSFLPIKLYSSYQLDSLTRTKNRLSDTKPSDYSQKMTN